MNPETGAIAHFENQQDAKAAGHTVPLTEHQTAKLMAMNRHDRRKWAAEQRARATAERLRNKRG